MFRRLPVAPLLFFALWMLWLVIPITRDAARSDWKRALAPSDPDSTPSPPSGTSRDALVAQALVANDNGKSFEALGKQFPGDAAICAGQLASGAKSLNLFFTRHPGPASNNNPNWSVSLYDGGPPSTPSSVPSPQPGFRIQIQHPPAAFLSSWFAACNRGAQLEPNNTFWDWMKIVGLMGARRDGEVWPVLRAAKSKTAYDDHLGDLSAAALRAERKEFGLMAPLDEFNAEENSISTELSMGSQMEEVARQLSENAWGLRLQNTAHSHTTALEGLRDFVFLCRTLRLQSKTLSSSIEGQRFEAKGLSGGYYTATNWRVNRLRVGAPLAVYASDKRYLLFWAKERGRADIAAQLGSEWVSFGKWRKNFKAKRLFPLTGREGIDGGDFSLAWAGDWFAPRFLAAMPFVAGLILLSSFLARVVPAWRRESDVAPSRASWFWGAALGALGMAMLSSSLIWNTALVLIATRTPPSNFAFAILFNPTSPISVSGAPRAWELAFPVALLWVSALAFAASWDAKQRNQPTLGARLRTLAQPSDDEISRFDLSPILALTSVVAALFISTAGVCAFLIVLASKEELAGLIPYSGLILGCWTFVISVPLGLRIKSARGRAFFFGLAKRFSWSFLLSASLIWGVARLATAPAHRRFEAQLDRTLRVGEFQLARKRLGF